MTAEWNKNEDAIDRMRNREKSWMNLLIIAVNIILFLLVEMTGNSYDGAHMIRWGAAYTPKISDGEYYRLFTSMFLHFGIEHLFNNMLLLFFMGDYLERYLGKVGYLVVYLLGGIAGNVLSYFLELNNMEVTISAGASGAVFAVVGGILMLLVRHRGRLEDLTLQRFLLMAILSIYVGFTESGVDNAAHIGGIAAGFIICIFCREKRKYPAI